MKILLVLASPEYLRYYDSTILLLAERGHSVALAVNKWNASSNAKSVDLEDFVRAHGDRLSVAGQVPERADRWQALARGVRGTMDYVRFLDPAYASADALRQRMRRKSLPRVLRPLARAQTLPRPGLRTLLRSLAVIEAAIPTSARIEQFLRQVEPDVVLVTPLVEAASPQVDVARCAQALGLPLGVCIADWDNLTNKGLIRIQPDTVLVWNEMQRREAVTMHGVPAERVVVTGAQVFDRWFDRRPSTSRAEFCHKVGLPAERPYILFVGSSGFISGPDHELAFVRSWIAAIRASTDVRVREVGILIRPHPYNAAHWSETDVSDLEAVAVWPRQRTSMRDETDRTALFDSLYHSSAVVGINTSALIEAAIVGRPVYTIQNAQFAATQSGTLHFHHLLPERGGFLHVAADFPEHLLQLEQMLAGRPTDQQAQAEFVTRFVRPHGINRACAPIVVEAIEQLGALRVAPVAPAFSTYPLRLCLMGLLGVLRIFTPPPFSRRLRRRLTKRVSTVARRLGRRARAVVKRTAAFKHSLRRRPAASRGTHR